MNTQDSAPSPRQPREFRLHARLRIEWAVLTIGMTLFVVFLSMGDRELGLQRMGRIPYDLSMQALADTPASPDIVLIAIDDTSLQQEGHWPWRRSVHATLLKHLRQAKAVGLDILFPDPQAADSEDDRRLAQAIREHGRVVLPEAMDPEGRVRLQPLPILRQAAAATGRIDVQPHPDGTVRTVTLWSSALDGTPVPHMALALAHVADGRPIEPGTPTSIDQASFINFTGPPRHYPIYPYAAVLRGEIPAETFRDRIVLVGAWATGLGDQIPTAVGGGLMAGVEVLANTLQNLRSGSWIQRADRLQTVLINLIPVWLICLILRKSSTRTAVIGVLAAIPLCLALDAASLHWLHYWVPPMAALLALIVIYPLWNWRIQEATLQYIDAELTRLQISGTSKRHTLPPSLRDDADSLPARGLRLHYAVSQLEQATRRREEALSFISHDMRAPQTAILAAVQLRERAPEEWSESDTLAHVTAQAHKTLSLVQQFVELAQAESVELEQQPYALGELLAECCRLAEPMAHQNATTIHCHGPDRPVIVQLDPRLMSRAIGNLLQNALHYGPENSRVECFVVSRPQAWEIHVRDRGPGIPADQIAHLFTRFWRGSQGKAQRTGGIGLGLAFVAVAAQRHDGYVRCDSIPGEGSTFIIGLPKTDAR